MTDDPDFFAWLDGELPEPQASAMAARVAADPELAAFAEQHRALGTRLAAAFAPIAVAPVSPRLAEAARPQAEVINFAAARERRRPSWSITGLAVAASLALGLAIGVALPDGGIVQSRGAQLAAAGPLESALDRQLASAGDQNGIRIGVTFKDQQGRFCRSFTAQAQSGLACRSGDDWRIEGTVAVQRQGTDYRMAGSGDPILGSLIDSRLSGEVLDATQESEIVRRKWKY